MRNALAVCLVGAVLAVAPATGQQNSVTITTGPAILVETGGAGASFAMTEADYQTMAAQLAKMAAFVPITRKPANAGADMRFGINLAYGGKNRSWALSGNDTDGYVLIPDANANGDLTDDAPIRMTRSDTKADGKQDGKYAAYFDTVVREPEGQFNVRMKFVVDRISPPGKTEKGLALLRYDTTRRSGEVMLDGVRTAFSVGGSDGLYDADYVGIRVDVNHDGTLDPVVEGYKNSEKYFNIGNRTYEFHTSRYGNTVTFTPLAEHKPARVVLLAGQPAPEFAFADLSGKSRHLSDYRGSVVLIDFWGTWCGPCVAAAPELVAAYERYHSQGLEIIGVDSGDTREKLTAFLADKKMTWPQTMESDKGPLATLFRVNGWPTYFLIDRDGRFAVAGDNGNFKLDAELAKLFQK